MIVILEGVNGVGKSTYATGLSDDFGYKIVRPFRGGNTNLHFSDDGTDQIGTLDVLKRMKIPFNTHIDDIYVADFLTTFDVNAILDRSVPSAIAYGTWNEEFGKGWYDSNAQMLYDLWLDMLKRTKQPILYVWLHAPYSETVERCEGRWCPRSRQYAHLEKWFNKMFQKFPYGKMRLDTSMIGASDGLLRVKKRIDDLME